MSTNQHPQTAHQEQENRFMKRDFFKALIIDGVFVLLLVALYFANRAYGFLDALAARFS
jgi:hypothetical protein